MDIEHPSLARRHPGDRGVRDDFVAMVFISHAAASARSETPAARSAAPCLGARPPSWRGD